VQAALQLGAQYIVQPQLPRALTVFASMLQVREGVREADRKIRQELDSRQIMKPASSEAARSAPRPRSCTHGVALLLQPRA
jgi:hypothetical protein